MSATQSEIWGAFDGTGPVREKLALRETHWGFAVSERASARDFVGIAETSMKVLALMSATLGGVLPLLPGYLADTASLFQRACMSASFVAIGVAVFFYALRGFRTELHVDHGKRQLRIGSRNNSGSFHEQKCFAAKDVESFFLQRTRGRTARLNLRLKGRAEAVRLFEGTEKEMVTLLERITLAVRAEMGDKRKARTETTGRFMHVTFS